MTKSSDTSRDVARLPMVPASAWLATLVVNLLGLGMPLVFLQIFDRVIPFQAFETLTVLLIGLVVVVLLELIQKNLRATLLNRVAQEHAVRLSGRITRNVLNASPMAKKISGRQAYSYLMSAAGVREHLSGQGRLFPIEFPFSFLALGLIWLLAGSLVLVPIAGLATLFVAATIVRNVHRNALAARTDADDRRYELFEQVIGHVTTVKANQMELGLLARYRDQHIKSSKAGRMTLFASNLFQSISQAISMGFAAAMILVGSLLVIEGAIGAAELAACTLLNSRAVQPLQQATQHWASGETFLHAKRQTQLALDIPQTEFVQAEHDEDWLEGNIELDSVTLRASRSGRAILRNFSLVTPDAGLVVLEGNASMSANVLFRAIMGDLEVEKGEIRVAGLPVSEVATRRGYGGVILIDAAPAIFEGSLLYNIALSQDADKIDMAYAAAGLMDLEAEINKLPNGYDTDMRDGGLKFASRGFLQRVNVARAICCQPAILLMDDCVNALDPGGQRDTAMALQAMAHTTLILAYDSTGCFGRFADNALTLKSPALDETQRTGSRPAASMSGTELRGAA